MPAGAASRGRKRRACRLWCKWRTMGLGTTLLPALAVEAGLLRGTSLATRPLVSDNHREIGLIWRKGTGRRHEFHLLAQELARRCRRRPNSAMGGDTTALFVEARGSGLLRRLRHKAGEFLSLMRECFHLLARKLALNVEGLFEVLFAERDAVRDQSSPGGWLRYTSRPSC